MDVEENRSHWLQAVYLKKLLFGGLLARFAEFAAPGQCMGCGCYVSGEMLCGRCVGRVNFSDSSWCDHCAMPPGSEHMAGCSQTDELFCERLLPWIEVRTIGGYGGMLRQACLIGKKGHGAWACRQLVSYWLKSNKGWLMAKRPIWVVPIPRHWGRAWIHGHDPAEALAEELARQMGSKEIRQGNFLKRQKATPHLAELTSRQRFELMREVFVCREKAAESLAKISSVLLVDDILTTGATAMAAASALKLAGARKIYLAAMARTLERVD